LTHPNLAADLAASADTYQAIVDAYRSTEPDDLGRMISELPPDRLNRLTIACRRLLLLVEEEVLLRNGLTSSVEGGTLAHDPG
jgi:hypothetical protein